jgi:hypothetical protein
MYGFGRGEFSFGGDFTGPELVSLHAPCGLRDQFEVKFRQHFDHGEEVRALPCYVKLTSK